MQGEELDESFVMDIILDKLNSKEIKHYGTCTELCLSASFEGMVSFRICIGWDTNFEYRLEAST